MIFKILEVKNIENFTSKISSIKKDANLEDNLLNLNINLKNSSEEIIKGINLLRLGNNPIKIDGKDIYDIISKNI